MHRQGLAEQDVDESDEISDPRAAPVRAPLGRRATINDIARIAEVSKKRIGVDLIPLTIAYDGRPRRAYGAAATTILNRVKSLSADHGTKVSIDDGIGRVVVKR